MKKYIPVFGPQELFDGTENCDEYLVAVQHSVGQKTKVSFYPSLVEAFNYVVDFPPRGVVFHRAAMRKIEEVPEPKRWTVADQKAGRLPEVGENIVYTKFGDYANSALTKDWKEGDEVQVIAITDVWNNGCLMAVVKNWNGREYTVSPVVIDRLKPIETPDEKAARLKSEWCTNAAKQLKNLEYTSTLTSIYDAILSGELPPVQAKDGA